MRNRTIFRHQAKFVHKAINSVWDSARKGLLKARQGSSLLLGGDGRCDSPGHSAKYCTYSIMDLEANQILTSELIQVSTYQSKKKIYI